jgi:3-oxoadipate enol-lactonase
MYFEFHIVLVRQASDRGLSSTEEMADDKVAVLPDSSSGQNHIPLTIDGIDFHIYFFLSSKPGRKSNNPFVVLSHALMADHHMWASTIHALTNAGYDVYTYDHIGHGMTGSQTQTWQDRGWRFDDFTLHIHEIIQALRPGETPVAVVGCSMGGVLALRYAMKHDLGSTKGKKADEKQKSDKKLKIVAIGAPGMKALEASIPKWEERLTLFREEGVDRLAHLTAARWVPNPAPPGLRERVEEMCRRTTLDGYERCVAAIVDYDYQSKGQLEELASAPNIDVLVIRGENDEAVGPKSILETVARRAGGRFVEMKGVGHVSPMHDPDEFERILLEFLNEP